MIRPLLITLLLVFMLQQGETPPASVLPATQLDVNIIRVAKLEQQVADQRAIILRKDIELSTCRATVDSITLTDRAKDLVDEFKRVYGGEWAWSTEQNRPVRLPANPVKEIKEPK